MKNNWKRLRKKDMDKMLKIRKIGAKLFNEKGYLETSIEDISSVAKLSKGAIYYYFSSKNEILFFIVDSYIDLVMEGLEQELKAIEDSSSKIQFFISRHIEFYINNVSEAKTLLHEARNLSPKYFKIIAQKERKYLQILSDIILDFLDGHIQKEKLTILTFSLLGMCNWIYSWYEPEGPITPQGLSEIIHDLFSKGVSSYEQSKLAGSRPQNS